MGAGQIDQVIQANLEKFKKPGALTVRPGYKMTGGWITKQPAIVVTVEKKLPNVSPQDALPANVGGYPTDVREATTIQKLRHTDPLRHATITATARPEYAQPEFPLERDIQSGQYLEKPVPPAPVAAHLAKPESPTRLHQGPRSHPCRGRCPLPATPVLMPGG